MWNNRPQWPESWSAPTGESPPGGRGGSPRDPATSENAEWNPWGHTVPDVYQDGQWAPVIAPVETRPENDQIRSDSYVPPYTAAGDLDDYGRETDEMRRAYDDLHRKEPSVRAAIDGKAASVAALDLIVKPRDKSKPNDQAAAAWVKEQIDDIGSDRLILNMLRPALVRGFSVGEKTLAGMDTPAGPRWGIGHVKSKDTANLRLRLDAYRNVLGVVNTVRGIRTHDPAKVILFTHADMYDNPFGQSDLRAAYRSANLINDAYQLWHIALKIYGQPFLVGKVKDDLRRKQMESALKAARGAGWLVSPSDDDVEILNFATATSFDAFEKKVNKCREEIFLAVRGGYLPFLEGSGSGGDAHGNSGVSKHSGSDPVEYLLAKAIGRCLSQQLVPDLVIPNFPAGTGMPIILLGGVNWAETNQQIDVAIKLKEKLGLDVSAEYIYDVIQMPPPKDSKLAGDTPPGPATPGAPGGAGDPGAPPGPGGLPSPAGANPSPSPAGPTSPAPSEKPPETFAAPSSPFPRESAARYADYFAGSQHGHYPGDMHEQFGMNEGAFADATGLQRKAVRRGGEPGWAWAVRPQTFSLDSPGSSGQAGGEEFAFESAKHPRDDHGRFLSGSKLAEAKHDPAKAEELRKSVTRPAERAKLDRVLGGEQHPLAHQPSRDAAADTSAYTRTPDGKQVVFHTPHGDVSMPAGQVDRMTGAGPRPSGENHVPGINRPPSSVHGRIGTRDPLAVPQIREAIANRLQIGEYTPTEASRTKQADARRYQSYGDTISALGLPPDRTQHHLEQLKAAGTAKEKSEALRAALDEHNAAGEATPVPKITPDGTPAAKAVADLPDAGALATAPREAVKTEGGVTGGSAQTLYKATVGGKQYLVKSAAKNGPVGEKNAADRAHAEELSSALAKDAGVSVPPAKVVDMGGKPHVVSEWVDGKPLSQGNAAESLKSVAPGEVSKMALFDFATGYNDNHLGNYLVGKDGKLHGIDRESSFGDGSKDMAFYLDENPLLKAAAGPGGDKARNALPLPREQASHMAGVADKAAQSLAHDPKKAAFAKDRAETLRRLAELPNPTVGDLIRLCETTSVAKPTPKPADPDLDMGTLLDHPEHTVTPGSRTGDAVAREEAARAKRSGIPASAFAAPPGGPPRPGLVWNEGTHRWRHPETGEEVEHTPASKSPKAKSDAHAAYLAASPKVKDALEAAYFNVAGAGTTPEKAHKFKDKRDLITQLGSSYDHLNDDSKATPADFAAMESAIRALIPGAVKLHDAGEVVPFDGAKMLAPAGGVFTGDKVQVEKSGWAMPEGDKPYVALKATVAKAPATIFAAPHPGLVLKEVSAGVHRWVKEGGGSGSGEQHETHPETGEHASDAAERMRTGKSDGSEVTGRLAGDEHLEKLLAQIPPQQQEKARGLFGRMSDAIHQFALKNAGIVGRLGQLGTLLDAAFTTPEDLAKQPWLMSKFGTTATTAGDHVADATSIPGMIVAKLAAAALCKGWSLLRKAAGFSESELSLTQIAGFLADLVNATTEGMGGKPVEASDVQTWLEGLTTARHAAGTQCFSAAVPLPPLPQKTDVERIADLSNKLTSWLGGAT